MLWQKEDIDMLTEKLQELTRSSFSSSNIGRCDDYAIFALCKVR